MRRFVTGFISITCLFALALGATDAVAAPEDAGSVRFAKAATASFDQYTVNPSSAQQQWMRDHYWRMRTYAPYFDSRLSWFSDAWTYKDAYAIYPNTSVAQQHPEWILKDAAGHRLYIPWGCGNGTCPQYAADIGDPGFRQYWIDEARQQLAAGYRGLFVDDVNMELRVGAGDGSQVAPRDPRTGQTMTLSDWRRYMAEFTEEIRAAFPTREIVHNALWFDGHADSFVARELKAADYVDMERGVNDSGITAGTGTYGYERFLSHVDWLHSQGIGAIYDSYATTNPEREYNMAAYFMAADGNDAIGTDSGGTPGDWWSGYDVSLGAAQGARYAWNGVLRRDFANGVVLVNEPGNPSRTLALDGTLRNVSGQQVSSVTLAGGQAAVLSGTTGGGTTGGGTTGGGTTGGGTTGGETTGGGTTGGGTTGGETTGGGTTGGGTTGGETTGGGTTGGGTTGGGTGGSTGESSGTVVRKDVRLRGRVGARRGRVTLRLSRQRAAGTWTTVRRTVVRVRRGHYQKQMVLRTGRYRVHVRFHASTASSLLRVA